MGHREMNPPPVRKVVRDADYSWGTSTMMNLYSGTTCPFSHRCRIVLYEKQMDFQVIDVDLFNKPEDIAVINPYNRVPVLVDRDLVLYEANIINEYIDERFPHPQLMPPDPQTRAEGAPAAATRWSTSCSATSIRSRRTSSRPTRRVPMCATA